MKNNKNRTRERQKSNSELRKMEPKDNADVGINDEKILGIHDGGHEKMRTDKKNANRKNALKLPVLRILNAKRDYPSMFENLIEQLIINLPQVDYKHLGEIL